MRIPRIYQLNNDYHYKMSNRKFSILSLLPVVLVIFCVSMQCFADEQFKVSVNLPNVEPVLPRTHGKFRSKMITESSGMVKSRIYDNVFWTHNDSGDIARLFAIDRDGNLITPSGTSAYKGVTVIGALNSDWEDMASDNSGNLYMGDIGNNNKDKELFTVYRIREPLPIGDTSALVEQTIKLYFPDKENPTSRQRQVNAEALFWAKDHLFIITKGGKSRFTDLYSLLLDNLEDENPLTLIASFDFKGMVTGADASPDGKQLVVLTYNGVWLFELGGESLNYFQGAISWLPIRAGQCEAICFDEDNLIISNEQGKLFEIALNNLIPITSPHLIRAVP